MGVEGNCSGERSAAALHRPLPTCLTRVSMGLPVQLVGLLLDHKSTMQRKFPPTPPPPPRIKHSDSVLVEYHHFTNSLLLLWVAKPGLTRPTKSIRSSMLHTSVCACRRCVPPRRLDNVSFGTGRSRSKHVVVRMRDDHSTHHQPTNQPTNQPANQPTTTTNGQRACRSTRMRDGWMATRLCFTYMTAKPNKEPTNV